MSRAPLQTAASFSSSGLEAGTDSVYSQELRAVSSPPGNVTRTPGSMSPTGSARSADSGLAPDNDGSAGLPAPSLVRMKLFTPDDRLIERRVGMLAPPDARAVEAALARLLDEG